MDAESPNLLWRPLMNQFSVRMKESQARLGQLAETAAADLKRSAKRLCDQALAKAKTAKQEGLVRLTDSGIRISAGQLKALKKLRTKLVH